MGANARRGMAAGVHARRGSVRVIVGALMFLVGALIFILPGLTTLQSQEKYDRELTLLPPIPVPPRPAALLLPIPVPPLRPTALTPLMEGHPLMRPTSSCWPTTRGSSLGLLVS